MTADGELPLVRRSGKSEAAFRTISEVAEELGVPQHVLRFWESKFPQVKPLKRGGGRRYYRPEDVQLLRRIRDLLYSEGYTIKGVQKLLREGGLKDMGAKGEEETRPAPDGADGDGGADEVAEDFAKSDDDDAPEAAPHLLVMDDGEGGGDDSCDTVVGCPPAVAEVPCEIRTFSPAQRRELVALLAELEHLRNLLHPHER